VLHAAAGWLGGVYTGDEPVGIATGAIRLLRHKLVARESAVTSSEAAAALDSGRAACSAAQAIIDADRQTLAALQEALRTAAGERKEKVLHAAAGWLGGVYTGDEPVGIATGAIRLRASEVGSEAYTQRLLRRMETRRSTLIRGFTDPRLYDEQLAAGNAMGRALAELVSPSIEPGDRWYAGGAAARRAVLDSDGLPVGIGSSEITRAFRQSPVIFDKRRPGRVSGTPGVLSAARLRKLAGSGLVRFFMVPRTHAHGSDVNPGVCDEAEDVAQGLLLDAHPDETTIRTRAAGSVARSDGQTEVGGYVLFAWLIKAAAFTPAHQVGFVPLAGSRTETTALTTLSFAQRVALCHSPSSSEAASSAAPPRAKRARLAAPAVPDAIDCVRDHMGIRSFWQSCVVGSVWTRCWGVEGRPGQRLAMDYGAGCEWIAAASHAREAAAKLDPPPGRRARRGVYVTVCSLQPHQQAEGEAVDVEEFEMELEEMEGAEEVEGAAEEHTVLRFPPA